MYNNTNSNIVKTILFVFMIFTPFLVFSQYGANDDFDGDGIINSIDLDDDNDGILDTVELAACNFNPNASGYKSTIVATTNAGVATGTVQNLLNGTESTDFYYTNQPTLSNINVATFQFPSAVIIKGIEVAADSAFINAGSSVKIQGSTNGSTWTDITTAFDPGAATASTYGLTTKSTQKFPFTNNNTAYSYYRILLVSGGLSSGPWVYEAYFSQVTSSFCDQDGDGISNQFDLDSDGDGCSDAKEANVTPAASLVAGGSLANAKFNFVSPTNDANNDGWFDGAAQTTYNLYALTNVLNACSDFDGDGIADLIDLDDDNDGILDAIESPSCFYTAAEVSTITNVTSQLAQYSTLAITNSYDNNLATTSAFNSGTNWVDLTVFDITPARPLAIASVDFIMGGYSLSNGAASTFKLQGFNGSSWTDLSAPISSTLATGTVTVPSSNTTTQYSRFRIVGVAGTVGWAYTNEIKLNPSATFSPSAYPKPTCTVDTDNDGKYNHQDLDSDGDGCSDAKEANVTPAASLVADGTLAKAKFSFVSPANDINNDGWFDGATQSSYSVYAITNVLNACADFDGDGISDVFDLDDDNDGILDAIESPSCFYTATEAATFKKISTPLANNNGVNTDLPFMRDNVTTSAAANDNVITINTATNGSVIYNLEYFAPVRLTAISYFGTTWGTSATGRIEASNDGSNWTSLMSAATAATGNVTFAVNQNGGLYRYYRLVKVDGSTTPAITTYEIQSTADATGYVPSANPKPACAVDTDNDGKYNHQDLDSDGDGCSDAKEANVTPAASLVADGTLANAKFSFVSPTNDTNNDGWFDGATQSSYNLYATTNVLNACADFDADGISDVFDLDDDNDGILDAVESPSCFYTAAEVSTITNVTSQLAQYSTFAITNSYDNNLATNSAFNSGTNWVDMTVFDITPARPLAIASVDFIMGPYSLSSAAGSTFKLQGFDGTSWIDLSAPISSTVTSGTATVPSSNTTTQYSRFRIVGVAGTVGWAYTNEIKLNPSATFSPSAYPKATCTVDTDNDGKYNHQDLDSDGDGCSDAKEANVTPAASLVADGTLANAKFSFVSPTNDTNNDGWFDGATQSSYTLYATTNVLNACADFDGDGISDVFDLDDDNDGILDAIESPSCFYTATEAVTFKNISTPLANNNGINTNLPFLKDNVTTSVAANDNVIAINAATNGSVIYNLEYFAPARLTAVSYFGTTWGTSATGRIEASNDGSTWTSLMSAATAATGNVTFTVNQNGGLYRYYRLVKVDGTTTPAITTYEIQSTADPTGYVPSANPKPACAVDTDNDGKYNHQDLDSDGDGCSDAKEANVTPAASLVADGTLANAKFSFVSPTNDTNNDGWFDGATQSSYNLYATTNVLNACADFDADGISDVFDLDDDNDGILDAVESPSCFYTATEAVTFKNISTPLTNNNGVNTDLPFLRDNVTANVVANNNVITSAAIGDVIYNMEYNAPVNLTTITHHGTTWGGSSTGRIEASNDGSNWTSLMSAATVATANPKTFTVNQNGGFYRYYRLVKVAGTASAVTTYEITNTFTETGYIPSANPKPACTVDTDNDGKYNHQDLDSDGDGCSDAKEANVTPAASLVADGTLSKAKFSFVSPTNDTNNDGWFDGATQSSYTLYATTNVLNACADFDGDGISDVFDLDDDNDGILDAIESPSCFYTATEATVFRNISTPLANNNGVNTDLPFMRDNVTTSAAANDNVITINTATNGSVIYNLEYFAPARLTAVSYFGTTWGTSATGRIEASNDGSNWTSLMSATTAATGNVTFTVNQNGGLYRYYRLVKVDGSTTPAITTYEIQSNADATGYVPSANPKPACTVDTDNDGKYNHQDLDSDGDGCSDAKEANVTPAASLVADGTLSNAKFSFVSPTNDTNNDGWFDGATQTTYGIYAITSGLNVCADTDGDGIGDLIDIDDDNDGITDAVELAACNVTLNTSAAKALMTSTSEIPASSGTAANLIDNTEANNYYYVGSSTIANKAVAQFDLGANYYLSGFEISTNGNSLFNTGATYKIQGSYDASSWTDLTGTTTAVTTLTAGTYNTASTATYKFPFTTTSGFRYYRVYGISGTVSGNPYVREVYFSPATPIFCDTDNDGISNEKDLDSDGDGCSDAKEASVTPANALVSSGILSNARFNFVSPNNDANNDGYYDGASQTTYKYALVSTFNACSSICTNNVPVAVTPNLFNVVSYQTTTTLSGLTFNSPGYTFDVTSEGYSSLTINFNANNCSALLQTQVLVNDSPIGTNCSSGSRTITNPTTVKLSAIRTGGTGNNFFPIFFWNGVGILWYDDGGGAVPEAIINITGVKNLCRVDSQKAFSSVTIADANIQSTATVTSNAAYALSIGSPYTVVGNQIYNAGVPTGLTVSGNDTNTLVISNIGVPALYKSVLESIMVRTVAGYLCSNTPATTISVVTDLCKQTDTFCYKPGIIDAGNTYPTKHGITALGRAGEDNSNWPMVRQSAWTVLEAKTKGFVINRVKFNASNLPVADDGVTRVITDAVEGMLVYDTINHCLKMYTSTDNGSTYGWYCLTNQACPD